MDAILYLCIQVHGANRGIHTDNVFTPRIMTVPERLQYVNKITYAPRGLVNFAYNLSSFGMGVVQHEILNEIVPMLHAENEDGPVVGEGLVERLRYLDSLQLNHQIITRDKDLMRTIAHRRWDNIGMVERELIRHADLTLTSVDTTTTREYINKSFAKTLGNPSDLDLDIVVVYQRGGNLNVYDKLMQAICDKYYGGTSYRLEIKLQDIFYYAIFSGYTSLVLIDFSCDCLVPSGAQAPVDVNSRTTRQYRREYNRRGILGGRTRRGRRRRRRHSNSHGMAERARAPPN